MGLLSGEVFKHSFLHSDWMKCLQYSHYKRLKLDLLMMSITPQVFSIVRFVRLLNKKRLKKASFLPTMQTHTHLKISFICCLYNKYLGTGDVHSSSTAGTSWERREVETALPTSCRYDTPSSGQATGIVYWNLLNNKNTKKYTSFKIVD